MKEENVRKLKYNENYEIFFNIVIDNFRKYYVASNNIRNNNDFDRNAEIENEKRVSILSLLEYDYKEQFKTYLIIVIFGAFILESFIYEYAINFFDEKYVKENLDRLDIESKWVIILRLTNNYIFDKSNNYFGLFKKLIYTRNYYAHSKSVTIQYDPDNFDDNPFEKIINNKNKMIHATDVIKVLFYFDNLIREINVNPPLTIMNTYHVLILNKDDQLRKYLLNRHIELLKSFNNLKK